MKKQPIIMFVDTMQKNKIIDAVIKRLMEYHTVHKIEILESISLFRLLTNKEKFEIFKTGIKSFKKSTVSYAPINIVPWQRYPPISSVNSVFAELQIKLILGFLGKWQRPIIWIDTITKQNSNFIFNLNERMCILHSHENSNDVTIVEKIYSREQRRIVSIWADMILVTSKAECKEKSKFNKETYFVSQDTSVSKIADAINKTINKLSDNPNKRRRLFFKFQ